MASTLYVNSSWSSCSAGDPVELNGNFYTYGTDAFSDIQSAVNAASTTEKTTINVCNGTYADDVYFRTTAGPSTGANYGDGTVVPEQKGDIDIVALGDNVVVTGTVTVGWYEKGTGSGAWDSNLSFDGIKFESYGSETDASLVIEGTSKGLTVENCEFTGKTKSAHLTWYVSGAIIGDHTYTNCSFKDGYVHSGGQHSTTFDNCSMTECSCNFTRGNAVALNNCTINKTLTDADGGDSFYVVRADGGVPVAINGGQINVDSTASASTVPGDKGWAVLWQKSGNALWTVSNIEVNYTAAAAANENLHFENDISTNVNRVTIDGLTYTVGGSAADDSALLATSKGYVIVEENGSKTLYYNGSVAASTATVYVDASWTSTSVLPAGAYWGINAFSSVEAAYAAVDKDGMIQVEDGSTADEHSKKIQITDGKGFTITGNAPSHIIPIFTLGGKTEPPDFATIPASTMNITDAHFGIAELDARPNATINVTNSVLTDHGGDSIIKSYFNGTINVASSTLEAMQVTTTGYITLNSGAVLTDTWQTNLYDNGIITVNAGATFNTSKMTIGHTYGRVNPDTDRAGKPATLDVNGGMLNGLATTHAYHYNTTDFFVGKDEDGLFLIRNGGTATLTHGHGLEICEKGTMSLTNGTLTVEVVTGSGSNEYAGTIRNAGVITLDTASSITAKALTGAGTIMIDATEFTTGVKKVIDLSQDAALTNVTVDTGDTGAKVVYGVDGDVVIHNIDQANVYANSAWTGYEVGDAIAGETGKYYGINAFANFTDAYYAAENNGTITICSDLDGTGLPNLGNYYTKNLTFVGAGENGARFNITLNNPLQVEATWTVGGLDDEDNPIATNIGFAAGGYQNGLNIRSNTGTLVVTDGATADLGYLYDRGTIEVNNGATLKAYYGLLPGTKSADGDPSVLTINDAQLVFDSNSYNLEGRFGNSAPASGVINVVLTDGKIIALDTVTPGIVFDATATVTATASAGKKSEITAATKITNSGTLNLSSTDVSAGTTITNSGAITIDTTSTITAASMDNASGTITIDATGFAANTMKKVIDLSQTTALTNVELTNVGDTGAKLVLGADGDVVVHNIDLSNLYVNSDWSDKKVGDEVTIGTGASAITAYYGINAFSTMKAATDAANSNAGATITIGKIGASELANKSNFTVAGNYVITGGNLTDAVSTRLMLNNTDTNVKLDGAIISLGKVRAGKTDAGAYVHNKLEIKDSLVGAAAADGAGGGWMTFYDTTITIDNSIIGAWFANAAYSGIATMPRSASAVKTTTGYTYLPYGAGLAGQNLGVARDLSVTNSTLATGFFCVTDRGTALVDNSVVYVGGSLAAGYQSGVGGNWSWCEASPTDYNLDGIATITFKDSIVRNIGYGNGNEGSGLRIGGTGKTGISGAGIINVNSSELLMDAGANKASEDITIFSNGALNITNGTVSGRNISNAGTITLSGASKLTGTITGAGTLTFDGATIADAIDASTNAGVFTGTNTINAALSLKNGTVGGTNTFNANVTFATDYKQGYKPVFNAADSTVTVKNADLTAKNFYIGSDQSTGVGTDTVNIDGGAIQSIAPGDTTAFYVRNNGVLNLTNGATLGNYSGNVVNLMDYNTVSLAGTSEKRAKAYLRSLMVYAGDFDDTEAVKTTAAVFTATNADIDVKSGNAGNEYTIVDGFKTQALVGGKSGKGEGTMTLTNSTLTVGIADEGKPGNFAIGNAENGTVTMNEGSVLNVASGSVGIGLAAGTGTLTIDATSAVTAKDVNVGANGAINITVGGTITAETFTNGGTITIDARGFTGYADVITVTGGDAQMGGTINLTKDEGSKLDVIKHANGSVSVGVVGDDIYFNKAWSTLADGASISVDSGTKTVHKGVDAFAELSDFTATAGKTLHFTSESASTAAVNGMLDGSELVKAQDAADDVTVTIANGTTFFQQKGDLTIGAGVTLAATKLMHFAKDTTITVDGTFQADDNAYLYAGKMIVNGSLTGDDVFLNGSGTNSYELTANGAIDVAKLRVGANATLKLAGGNVTTTQGMFVTAATGTVNVNNHASIEGGLTNAGTINVADSKALSLTGAVDNSGKINLAAGSTLVSDMITNTNAINGNSGAIEADSIINGASDGSVKGTITAATLNADSIVNNNGAAKKGGSSIELTGDLEAGTITNGVAPIVPGTDEPADKALIKAANITAGSITNFGTIGSQTSELEHTLDTIELTGGLDNGQYGNVMADKLFAASLDNYNEVLVNNINIDGVINNYAGAAIALNGGEGSTGHIDIEAASVSNAGYIKTLSGGSIKVTGNLFNDTYAELTGDLEKGLIETDSIEADTVTNNGKIDVKVSMDIDGSVTNNASGTINLASGATLDAAAVANNGTINVFGAGKVNSEITGTGKVTFEDATVDGFASTGNDAVFYGDSNLTGEVKFNAASYIQGYDGYLNTEDSTVTVSNGSLTARNFYVGSNKLGDVTNTLVADNAQILSDAPSNTTTFYVRCYGEMELTNGSQLGNTPGNVVNMMNYGSVTLTDSTAYLNGFVVYGGDINDTDGADGFTTATFTAIGSTIDVRGKYGSKFTIVDGFTTSVVVGGKSSKGDGIVNLSDSTFTVGNNEVTADLAIGFAKDGTVNVNDGSTLTVTGTIGIGLAAGTGTLTVDATSTVTANAITFGDNGSINLTIDAADLTEASYTLIDITGTQALDTAKITVNGEAFADGATYGNYTLKLWDGDVMLFKTPVADTTTLYVSESYTGYYGQEVAEGKYYGINAFDNLVDAFDSRKDDTVAVNLDDVSSIASTGKKEWVISQDTTISGNNAATVDLAGSDFRFYANDEDAEHIKTLTIDEDVTINLNGTNGNTATFYIGRNSGEFAGMDATINGTLNVDQFYSAYGSQVTMTGKLKTKGALMMHGATNENNANKVIQRNGVVVFDGTGKEYSADNLQVNVPSYLGLFGGDMTFKNTFAKFGGEIHLYNYKDIAEGPRSLTLDNANVTGKTLTVADNATVTLVNGSTLKVNNSGTVDATSTITVTASTFEAASLNTAGTFTVSGTSLLTIDTLTGTITVNDDATLTGSSVVGGSIAVAAGKVLTVGDTTKTATSFGAVTNAGEIDIDGASVNLGAITNNGTINMDWNDKLTFSGYDGTGLVNINMTGYRSTASGTVMDYIGGGTMDAGKYMDMTGMDAVEFNKYFTVSNNDLVLKSSIVVPTDAYPVGQVKKAVADAKANGENLTLNDAQYTVAALGDSKYLELDDVNTTVNGGTFDVHVNGGTIVDLEDEDDSGKIGTKTAPVNTSVTINDGTFNKTVTGADRFNEGASIIRYGNSELTINGGTFNSVVAGGMLYAQESSGSAKIRGDVTLTINGGSFANFVYGGSFAGKKLMASCTSIDVLDSTTGTGGNVTIAIDATNAGKNGISFGKDLVLGSHGTGKVKKDAKLIFSGSGTITVTGQIWGSSSGDYYIIKADGTRTIDTSIEGDRLLSFTGFTGALVCDRIRGFESFAAIDSDFDLSGAVSLSDIHNWEIGDSTIGGAFVSDFTGDTLTLTSLKSGVIFEDVSRFQLTKTEDGITTSLFKAVQYKVADNDFVAMNFDGASEWASADNKYRLYLSDNADGKTEMMFELA